MDNEKRDKDITPSGLRNGLTLLKRAQTYQKFETLLKDVDFQGLQDGIFSLLIVAIFESRKRGKENILFESAPSLCLTFFLSGFFSTAFDSKASYTILLRIERGIF